MRDARWLVAICLAVSIGALWPSSSQPIIAVRRTDAEVAVSASHIPTGAAVTVDVVPDAPPLRRVVEYDDPRYARGRGMSDRFAIGFPVHVRAALGDRGIAATADRVDADGLVAVLAGDPSGVCLVVPGGILPSTVRSNGRDALRSFVERGGTVVWAGAPFDLYYSMRGGAGGIVSKPDPSAWPALYRPDGPLQTEADIGSPPLRFALVAAPLQRATGLTFVATTFAVDARRLASAGGEPLAFVDDRGDSSVSQLPIGRGRIVIFGDTFADEMDAAREVAQVIASGAWFAPRELHVAATIDSGSLEATVIVPPDKRLFAFGPAPFYVPFGD